MTSGLGLVASGPVEATHQVLHTDVLSSATSSAVFVLTTNGGMFVRISSGGKKTSLPGMFLTNPVGGNNKISGGIRHNFHKDTLQL